jgi:hypothetical protein
MQFQMFLKYSIFLKTFKIFGGTRARKHDFLYTAKLFCINCETRQKSVIPAAVF